MLIDLIFHHHNFELVQDRLISPLKHNTFILESLTGGPFCFAEADKELRNGDDEEKVEDCSESRGKITLMITMLFRPGENQWWTEGTHRVTIPFLDHESHLKIDDERCSEENIIQYSRREFWEGIGIRIFTVDFDELYDKTKNYPLASYLNSVMSRVLECYCRKTREDYK
ncbi:hypothetical protein C8R41DRAFT_867029 [Lentinula lateritia]|uniref:Uncharacterized protein n=1 Tax=Lentinula lateritia TaxID=40482 RepID=A0ABQ8VGL3_9AGAR|nr:hypothetical protein C8R41DRAFT_867029 [Lentinula lateritia]